MTNSLEFTGELCPSVNSMDSEGTSRRMTSSLYTFVFFEKKLGQPYPAIIFGRNYILFLLLF